MKKIIFTLLFILSSSAFGQTFSVFNIDTSNYPTMKASFLAFDSAGKRLDNFSTNDFEVKENGEIRKVLNVNCPNVQAPVALSSVLVMDVSTSMTGPGLDIARSSALAWIDIVNLGVNDCALTSFSTQSYINRDFTTNKNNLINGVNSLQTISGTNYDSAFLDLNTGALSIAQQGKHKRIIIFLTDGMPNFTPKTQEIIKQAKANNITIYCLTIRFNAPQCIKDFTSQTGGMYFENIKSKEEAIECYRKIYLYVQNSKPCVIEWESKNKCEQILINSEISYLPRSLKQSFSYQYPLNFTSKLELSNTYIRFTNPTPGIKVEQSINITAYNSDFYIKNIKSSNPAFSIDKTNFLLPKGQSQKLNVSYTPLDSGYAYTHFTIETDLCDITFFSSAGFSGKPPLTKTLRLLKPNGGEVFVVASDTLITWDGITDKDTVKIEYSLDSGKTWKMIIDKTTSLKYLWTKIPLPASDKCKVRIKQYNNSDTIDDKIYLMKSIPHTNFVNEVAWSPDGRRVVTAGEDGNAYVYDVLNKSIVANLCISKVGVKNILWSPDDSFIITGNADGINTVWDSQTFKPIKTLKKSYYYTPGLALSPDLKKLLSGSLYGSSINIWDINTGDSIATINSKSELLNNPVWSADGNYIYTAAKTSPSVSIRIYDAITGDSLTRFPAHDYDIYNLNVSPNGLQLASVGSYYCKVWDTKTWANLQTIKSEYILRQIRWSPDGLTLACSAENFKGECCILVWDLFSGQLLHKLSGHTARINNISWSPNGNRLASASDDHKIIIWDVSTGSQIQTLWDHLNTVLYTAWSPDGSMLASGSYDNTAKIWHLGAGKSVLQQDESDAVFSIVEPKAKAMSVDMGKCLVSMSKDSVVTQFTQNIGSYKCRIDSIYIQGADAGAFRLIGGFPKYEIDKAGAHFAEFNFKPSRIGVHNAEIVVVTQSETLKVPITGEGVAMQLQIMCGVLDFGKVEVGSEKVFTDTIIVKNISIAPISITKIVKMSPDLEQFDILSGGNPVVLNAGESHKMTLRFKPKFGGRTSGRIGFEYNGTGSPITATLFGTGIGGVVVSSSDSAYSGEKKNILITLKNIKPAGLQAMAKSFSANLKFQGRILAPQDFSLVQTFKNDSISMRVSGDLPNDSTILSIPMIAGLGNVEETSIEISNFKLYDNLGALIDYDMEVEYGTFKLLGICRDSGTRLVNPNSQAQILSVRPNPATNAINIEYQLTEKGGADFLLINDLGETVKQISYGEISDYSQRLETIILDDLANGRYTLILKTPTISERRSVLVVK